jgi:uncharacterized protein (DUF1697 family)
MTVYVALLRGVNVGAKNRLKMADLQHTLEAIGLGKVETYIQSGNLIFQSNQTEEALREKIELEIKLGFGLTISVVLRSADELEQLIRNCPFTEDEIKQAEKANTEGESLYVAMLPKAPLKEKIEPLNKYVTSEDKFQIKNRDLYLLLSHSSRNSKLAGNLQKLNEPVTVRNWNTIQKLDEIAKARNKLD